MDNLSPITVARFWSKVSRTRDIEKCWEWKAGTSDKGYGRFRCSDAGRKTLRAHRIAYLISRGPIPDGMVVMHSCDNPLCCNPRHLSCGTVAENNKQTRQRGRHQNGSTIFKRRLKRPG